MNFFGIAYIACRANKELRSARVLRGLSLRRVAEQVGISAPFLYEIELGKRNCSEENAKKIERFLLSQNVLNNELDGKAMEDGK